MATRWSMGLGLVGVGIVAGAMAALWPFVFFAAPFAWTGEHDRLARALGVSAGMRVADIGAGSGDLAEAMARLVGSAGEVYATELSPRRRDEIARRVAERRLTNLQVVAAGAVETGLPVSCCDGVYMRTVLHHVTDRARFVDEVARAVRPGGRVAVIDFPPGSLWFHGSDHDVTPDAVREVFDKAGWRLREQVDDWGGGMYLLVFERDPASSRR